ncbi:MAG: hypothetical protein JW841_09395 [Deltaproteobacteria bacterium]|nr:hypothetical protein [Deltaproteobacteria bacterium]
MSKNDKPITLDNNTASASTGWSLYYGVGSFWHMPKTTIAATNTTDEQGSSASLEIDQQEKSSTAAFNRISAITTSASLQIATPNSGNIKRLQKAKNISVKVLATGAKHMFSATGEIAGCGESICYYLKNTKLFYNYIDWHILNLFESCFRYEKYADLSYKEYYSKYSFNRKGDIPEKLAYHFCAGVGEFIPQILMLLTGATALNIGTKVKYISTGSLAMRVFINWVRTLSLPILMSIQSAAEAIQADAGDSEIAIETMKGFACGTNLFALLHIISFLPRPVRYGLAAIIFGGPALVAELAKPPEERDYEKPIAYALIGIAIVSHKKGMSWKKISEEVKRINSEQIKEGARFLRKFFEKGKKAKGNAENEPSTEPKVENDLTFDTEATTRHTCAKEIELAESYVKVIKQNSDTFEKNLKPVDETNIGEVETKTIKALEEDISKCENGYAEHEVAANRLDSDAKNNLKPIRKCLTGVIARAHVLMDLARLKNEAAQLQKDIAKFYNLYGKQSSGELAKKRTPLTDQARDIRDRSLSLNQRIEALKEKAYNIADNSPAGHAIKAIDDIITAGFKLHDNLTTIFSRLENRVKAPSAGKKLTQPQAMKAVQEILVKFQATYHKFLDATILNAEQYYAQEARRLYNEAQNLIDGYDLRNYYDETVVRQMKEGFNAAKENHKLFPEAPATAAGKVELALDNAIAAAKQEGDFAIDKISVAEAKQIAQQCLADAKKIITENMLDFKQTGNEGIAEKLRQAKTEINKIASVESTSVTSALADDCVGKFKIIITDDVQHRNMINGFADPPTLENLNAYTETIVDEVQTTFGKTKKTIENNVDNSQGQQELETQRLKLKNARNDIIRVRDALEALIKVYKAQMQALGESESKSIKESPVYTKLCNICRQICQQLSKLNVQDNNLKERLKQLDPNFALKQRYEKQVKNIEINLNKIKKLQTRVNTFNASDAKKFGPAIEVQIDALDAANKKAAKIDRSIAPRLCKMANSCKYTFSNIAKQIKADLKNLRSN